MGQEQLPGMEVAVGGREVKAWRDTDEAEDTPVQDTILGKIWRLSTANTISVDNNLVQGGKVCTNMEETVQEAIEGSKLLGFWSQHYIYSL
eukprot:671584-Ditylum_brightwellii.AAC.1